MLQVKQFRYHLDNLGYLLYGEKYAMAVDGGAFDEILSFADSRRLSLLFVTNTHGHMDHTNGNATLLNEANARLLRYEEIRGTEIELEGQNIRIYDTPGHTADSLCFHVGNALITGDTLFNGTIGNCFSGDLKGFYQSIKKIMSLPGSTVIYAGHDYVQEAMSFARRLEPDNEYIKIFAKNYKQDHVFSRLMEELRVNPYLRFNEPGIINLLKKNGLPRKTEWQRWQSLMTID
ncbi:MAG: MBL fold metallo-hydrolase [Syntrophales bacterium]|jgi:hydroxyacylglutathione hydrolase